MQHSFDRGLVLLGCGKMGSAMLAGWIKAGVDPKLIYAIDPFPSEWLQQQGIHLNTDLPKAPDFVLVAVKPQMMADALPSLKRMGNSETVFLSVAAGVSIATYEDILGRNTPIIRAMPNTPAAIGQGITAMFGNSSTTDAQMQTADALLEVIGQVVRLDSESQMDAVTGVSGSGPAYVFHLIETLTAAGKEQGLPAELALQLAKTTVAGAGALADQSTETPEQLRINVTSPNGTTQAGLDVLMDPDTGLGPQIGKTVAAATQRSKDLGRG